jgi:hypothetical protein
MLNKLLSHNPEDKKLQQVLGMALSAIVLLFCFLNVLTVSTKVFGMKIAESYNMFGFAENADAGLVSILAILTIICSLGSLALLILPMAGIDLKLPEMFTWLPGLAAGGLEILAILMGWISCMDDVKEAKSYGVDFFAGPNFLGFIAILFAAAACAYAFLRIKPIKAPAANNQ